MENMPNPEKLSNLKSKVEKLQMPEIKSLGDTQFSLTLSGLDLVLIGRAIRDQSAHLERSLAQLGGVLRPDVVELSRVSTNRLRELGNHFLNAIPK